MATSDKNVVLVGTVDVDPEGDEVPVAKRLKTEDESELPSSSIHDTLSDFGNVKLVETINENASSTFLRCRVEPSPAETIVILEKKPFKSEDVEKILSSETTVKQTLQNDIYGTYECLIKPEHNGVKATVIHPATKKHVDKFRRRPVHMVRETADDYVRFTLPFIEKRIQFSLQVAREAVGHWVENILEHKRESDRIVFEDQDPEDGFVLLPDMKWDQERLADLYLVAICRRRGVRSLRDLRGDQHLPLLRNIRDKALLAIREKYGVLGHNLRAFLHYQPSYYHLHVHFKHVCGDPAIVTAERSHLLDTVISNLELMADYYERVRITYAVKEGDPIYDIFKNAGKFDIKKEN